jgi:hypothetical protein
MALAFQVQRHNIESTTGSSINQSGSFTFNRPVRTAEVALNGFRLEFNNEDHHVHVAEVDINRGSISNATVNYTYQFLLRDRSGNIDDPYEGYVQVLIIADLV